MDFYFILYWMHCISWIQSSAFFEKGKGVEGSTKGFFGESVCMQCRARCFSHVLTQGHPELYITHQFWASHAPSPCSKVQVQTPNASAGLSTPTMTYPQLVSCTSPPAPAPWMLILPSTLATMYFPLFKWHDRICFRVKVWACELCLQLGLPLLLTF